ncbi:MAG TPA: FAD-dependent monooxygenase, partial [Mycobacterium sp.]|nr:FAD-dependent monooxygenase [Mycobacterium sp.]
MINVDGHELASFPVGQPTRLGGPRGLLMSQADIEGALRDRLAALDGDVEWGRGVARLEPGQDGVALRLDDGTEADASWVVGADGAHSVIRKAMGVGFPGVPIVERFLLADVHADLDLQREGATSWLRGDMALAVFPLPDDVWRVMAPAPTEFGDEPAPEAILDYLGERLTAEAGGVIRSVEWTSSFRIHRRLADSYRRGRMLRAGDAAHIHSPLGGQGMNT